MFDNVRVAFIGLRSNKLRAALTMLGITIGVAAVIVLVSIGQAVDTYVRDQFLGIGTNLLIVFAQEDDQGVFDPLTMGEAMALADPFKVPDASGVMPQRVVTRPVSYENKEVSVRILGVPPNYLQIRSRSMVSGEFFNQADMESEARVAAIGLETAKRLFPDGTYPVGQTIRIRGIPFRIIGVLNRVGGGGFGPSDDDLLVIPLTTVQSRLTGDRNVSGQRFVSNVVVQARDAESVELVSQQIRETLREERRISFRDEDTFQIFTQSDLLASLGNVTGLLTIFLSLIAGISLLVGGIGIMNIMLVTVTERTREIGLRKAVGAQRRDILFQFLVEAMTLSLLGGGIGVLIAAGGTSALTVLLPDLEAQVQPSGVVLATVISVFVGVFFGIYPANRAASLSPIDALRYE